MAGDDRANISEEMTLVLRFEDHAGQVKNGKKARWEKVCQRMKGTGHAGLNRCSKGFKFRSTYRSKALKGFK